MVHCQVIARRALTQSPTMHLPPTSHGRDPCIQLQIQARQQGRQTRIDDTVTFNSVKEGMS
jgi:hypothetical protein